MAIKMIFPLSLWSAPLYLRYHQWILSFSTGENTWMKFFPGWREEFHFFDSFSNGERARSKILILSLSLSSIEFSISVVPAATAASSSGGRKWQPGMLRGDRILNGFAMQLVFKDHSRLPVLLFLPPPKANPINLPKNISLMSSDRFPWFRRISLTLFRSRLNTPFIREGRRYREKKNILR